MSVQPMHGIRKAVSPLQYLPLCVGQCLVWQSREQYLATPQAPQHDLATPCSLQFQHHGTETSSHCSLISERDRSITWCNGAPKVFKARRPSTVRSTKGQRTQKVLPTKHLMSSGSALASIIHPLFFFQLHHAARIYHAYRHWTGGSPVSQFGPCY